MTGDVLERAYEGRAVRHEGRYHCLAYPCPNITEWFYIPQNSHLCADCMRKHELARAKSSAKPLPASPTP